MTASAHRRRRLLSRALPLAAAALAAFATGAFVGVRHGAADAVGKRYASAWARGDYAAMHAMLAPGAQRRWPVRRFVELHRRAAATATVTAVRPDGPVGETDDAHVVPLRARTRMFGVLRGDVRLPLTELEDRRAVRWAPHLALPGLRPGERLERRTTMPPRAALLARDGTALAEGPARTSSLGSLAAEVAGRVGPISPGAAATYAARGYPPDALVGSTGLERQFEDRLRGRFGGTLRAGARVLATTAPRAGRAVRTSIDPDIQRAAVDALAGRLGGAAAVDPRTGEVLALAGLATSAAQPPGSVFKVVTLGAALEHRVVRRRQRFPVQTAAILEGVELQNANREACGGSLANAFAHSCNSVFAPMGVELGAERLVRAAERFGFNRPLGVAGAVVPSVPPAEEIAGDLAVGSTAIGQGRLLSTPLHQALVTAAIANGGELVRPSLEAGVAGRRTRAVPQRVAATVGRFMRRVVTAGTGTRARIEGTAVAGKTGTAELRDSTPDEGDPAAGERPAANDPTDTTAWFVAHAPAGRPKVAVAVMLVGAGAGGDTAAPAARDILLAGLRD